MLTATKEKPILFSGPMVRAILAGTKTQTRRVVKLDDPAGYDFVTDTGIERREWTADFIAKWVKCPYGQPGDRLWVRETFAYYPDERHVIYREREGVELAEGGVDLSGCWKPSIHMPHWASRITLEITDVRVERLQGITEEDAVAEGFTAHTMRWWQGFIRHPDGSRSMMEGGASPNGPPPPDYEHPELQTMTRPARDGFETLWCQLNSQRNDGAFAWHKNPWVWVVSFKRVDAPTSPATAPTPPGA